jgi:hypothetical protein
MVCSLASLLPKRFLTYIIGQIIFCNFLQLFAIFGDFNTYISKYLLIIKKKVNTKTVQIVVIL